MQHEEAAEGNNRLHAGKLTLDELKGKAKKPEAAERAAKLLKAKDKNGDGALTFEELTAKPERKKPANGVAVWRQSAGGRGMPVEGEKDVAWVENELDASLPA
ncbi:MAG: hypothetical protein HQ567_01550 [Candidatus Nealsonbacteria bacterium]|nr:hypothetical protein [Candidatus Nealsonbacteria bacterium]